MIQPRNLVVALDLGGLGQKEFADLGGWTLGHVNRWIRQRRADARPVPSIALALALAYAQLGPRQRDALWAELEGIGEDRAAFAFAFAYAKLSSAERDAILSDLSAAHMGALYAA